MSKVLFIIVLFGLSVLLPTFGQTSNKLKKQEKELKNKIANTKNLIKMTKASEQITIAELAIINHQIAYREELVHNINYQMRKLDDEIEDIEVQTIQIENNLKVLKEEYIKMLQYAYKNRNTDYELFYIFSAESYAEGYQRMKYIEQYATYRTKQVAKIKATKILLEEKLASLAAIKEEKDMLASEHKEEAGNFLKDKQAQQSALIKLKENELELKNDLAKHEAKKKKIAGKIKAALLAEIKKEAAKNKGKVGFEMAPEAVALSKNFTANKGKLPWPVTKGAITEKYGTHAHATLAGVKIDNQGIDITTTLGADVRTVFSGKVSSVFTIPGAGKVVMISHGNYRTVYSNLQEVYVSKGEKVSTKSKVGKLLPAENGKVSVAHLEIWKISSTSTKTENPSLWIFK